METSSCQPSPVERAIVAAAINAVRDFAGPDINELTAERVLTFWHRYNQLDDHEISAVAREFRSSKKPSLIEVECVGSMCGEPPAVGYSGISRSRSGTQAIEAADRYRVESAPYSRLDDLQS